MPEHVSPRNVGAPDPELKNSPIFDHESEEYEYMDLELETGVCYFNGVSYPIGQYVASGGELLRCSERGVWIRVGPSYVRTEVPRSGPE